MTHAVKTPAMPAKTTHYPELSPNPDFTAIEAEVLDFWKRSGAFEQSVKQRDGQKEYVFYDGPPFANGLPHYGHLLTGYVKDLYARYHTMKGSKVERRFGWDCHGLPAEMGAEKELGISGRQAIQKFGIQNFNEHCRTSVMKYAGEWEGYVNRQARWVDFQGDYKTMDKNFMESVLWAFKQLYDKGLVYESYRVMPYSWAAETPLSNFETKLDNSYRTRTDKAVTVKFKLKEVPAWLQEDIKKFKEAKGSENNILNPDFDPKEIYVIGWTTTPWTLPSNLALAVSREQQYRAFYKDSSLIFASQDWVHHNEQKASQLLEYPVDINGKPLSNDGTPIIEYIKCDGSDLIDLTYEPLFPYFEGTQGAFRILDGSSFIEEGSGTGVVHMAPGFGEDDQRVCKENGIEVVVPVDEQGKYTDEIYDIPFYCHPRESGDPVDSRLHGNDKEAVLSLKGLNVIADKRIEPQDEALHIKEKDVEQFGLANMRIVRWLKANNKLVKDEPFSHNYPHCWRTDTPLIYRALPSWYVEVTKFRDRAALLNQRINWIPEHIRDGQMGHMLATAPDWSISRNRFWGTPIPIWRTESGKTKAFGSIAELEEFFGQKVEDLHRPYIDELTKTDADGTWTRVSDVFDCWFESGSMPFAQVHYPFENKEWFETHFPADFITEYVGQTRGWFNTLIMLSTALFDREPFKNCICHGVVIDEESGLKYSKRLKNYKDPMEVFDKYGADALRWLMVASPVMRGADLGVDPDGKFIHDVVRLYIKPIWNAYTFFTLYANADGVKAKHNTSSTNLMDRYILAKCAAAVREIEQGLDGYDSPRACKAVSDFFEVLNNWYIRRNKDRFWNESGSDTDQAAYDTLYTVLSTLCRAAAPLLPMTLDAIYRGLTGEGSVHLETFPDVSAFPADADLVADMDRVRDACTAILSVRSAVNVRVRQPLGSVTLYGAGSARLKAYADLVQDEVNVKQVVFADDLNEVAERKLKLNSQVIGKRLPAKMKQLIPASKQGQWEMKDGKLHICDEVLLPEEYELNLEPKAGIKGAAPLSSNDALVVLDLTLTPELEAEGLARDFIRMVQDARKKADLKVSDRISLRYEASGKVGAAIAAHAADMIAPQVLATTLTAGDVVSCAHRFEQALEGENVQFGFAVVV